jgi:diacylglycerol kinase (ATP)
VSGRPLVIINPASAGGSTRAAWPGIASDLARHFGPFDCGFTTAQGDGRLLAIKAAAEGRKFLIACGGDGTVSEVANGIIESGKDVELGVLPSGTGGDFRRSIEMPTRPADAALRLKEGHTRRMDVGRVTFINRKGEHESRYFLGVASFGISGEVIERVKRKASNWTAALPGNWLGGKATFARAMLETTLSAAPKSVDIEIDGSTPRRIKVVNFCVANARYFGGGMKIAPDAGLDDGLFDVVEIGDLSALQILANSPKLYTGTHLNLQQVRHGKARSVKAWATNREEPITIEVDGELPGTLPASFEILPSAIRVRCGFASSVQIGSRITVP